MTSALPGTEAIHPYETNIRRAFYSLYAAIFLTLEISLALFIIKWNHPASVALFAVLTVLFSGSSYGISRQVIALATHYHPPQRLSSAPQGRRVAILYATMNDVVTECLTAIRQTYPCDVFVLDDSTNQEARSIIDSISAEHHYTVVRRSQRRGFKAGAINDWLQQHPHYDYIVLLDSDSYIPSDWVEEALKFSEHPSNRRVAIFQGMINIWNLDTGFVRTLAAMTRIGQLVWEQQLANVLDAVFCYGHNVIIRVSALKEVGGFVEGYVSEDFATAVAMAERNWHSRFVPLHTYEAMPENVRGFIKRQNKWTRGSMEFFGFARKKVPKSRKFHLLQIPIGHITNLLLPLGMFLTVYGFSSTPSSAAAFLQRFLSNPVGTYWSVPILRFMAILGVFVSAVSIAVRYACGISWSAYLKHRWLSSAISSISIPYEFKSIIAYFASGLRTIPVTPKNEIPLSLGEVMRISAYSMVIEGMLWFGIVVFNPLGAVYNSIWLVPMMFSPAIIMKFGGKRSYLTDTAMTVDARVSPSCLFPNPVMVNTFLKNQRLRPVSGIQT
jgi:cellulose synthase/poly-beta-1,6-N-acetylglucosamine synthase-like glycosyltransferase